MAPRIGKNLAALLAQLPQDGLGARVAPVRWALKDAANSYYTITTSSLRFVNKTDGLGYPLRISPEDGKTIVPADLKYTLARAAEAESEAAEKLRAQKAGEGMAEEDLKSALRTDEELNEKLISWRAGQVLRPHGKAWGTLVWKGHRAESLIGGGYTAKPIRKHIYRQPWREICDEPITIEELKAHMPTPKPKGHRRPR